MNTPPANPYVPRLAFSLGVVPCLKTTRLVTGSKPTRTVLLARKQAIGDVGSAPPALVGGNPDQVALHCFNHPSKIAIDDVSCRPLTGTNSTYPQQITSIKLYEGRPSDKLPDLPAWQTMAESIAASVPGSAEALVRVQEVNRNMGRGKAEKVQVFSIKFTGDPLALSAIAAKCWDPNSSLASMPVYSQTSWQLPWTAAEGVMPLAYDPPAAAARQFQDTVPCLLTVTSGSLRRELSQEGAVMLLLLDAIAADYRAGALTVDQLLTLEVESVRYGRGRTIALQFSTIGSAAEFAAGGTVSISDGAGTTITLTPVSPETPASLQHSIRLTCDVRLGGETGADGVELVAEQITTLLKETSKLVKSAAVSTAANTPWARIAQGVTFIVATPSGPLTLEGPELAAPEQLLPACYTPLNNGLSSMLPALPLLYARSGVDIVIACADPASAYWAVVAWATTKHTLDGHPVRASMHRGSSVAGSPQDPRDPQQARSLLYALAKQQKYRLLSAAQLQETAVRDVLKAALARALKQPRDSFLQLQPADTVSPSRHLHADLMADLLADPELMEGIGAPQEQSPRRDTTPFKQPAPLDDPALQQQQQREAEAAALLEAERAREAAEQQQQQEREAAALQQQEREAAEAELARLQESIAARKAQLAAMQQQEAPLSPGKAAAPPLPKKQRQEHNKETESGLAPNQDTHMQEVE